MERGQRHAHGQEFESSGLPENDPYDFGPLTRRQAENVADFAIRRYEGRQYEKLGRAVASKVLYLVGALSLLVWSHLDNRFVKLVDWLVK